MSTRSICLRGVEVHNLKQVDLDLPHRSWITICGVSGSGKTSLALDTLYAEGQRRYIESISAYTRQFLEQLEKPPAESIEGIPPAIAVTHSNRSRSSRATVGTTTETVDYLRLLISKIGTVVCDQCGRDVRRDSPQTAIEELANLPAHTRLMVAFPVTVADGEDLSDHLANFQQQGYVRAIVGERVEQLDSQLADQRSVHPKSGSGENNERSICIVVDRLKVGQSSETRLRDTFETACESGGGSWLVLAEQTAAEPGERNVRHTTLHTIDGREWQQFAFSQQLRCDHCQCDYPDPEPRLLSFSSPLGACGHCEGFGNIIDIDMDLVVPDAEKSLRQGAIAPWTTPAYSHELDDLLALAADFDLPVDVPYHELTDAQRSLIYEGVVQRDFGGLRGFFAWLERRKYKMHLRVFLSRWRTARPCPDCLGQRLRSEALAVRLAGKNIADICNMKIECAIRFFADLTLTPWQQEVGRTMLDQVQSRLGYLAEVGLDYLTLDRPMRTLSGGEAQRVALTTTLGSNLSGMLYVLDEPSVGLHPNDIQQLTGAVARLHRRGNTVVVVEHEPLMIRAAQQVVEMGPGAGEHGGRVVFQGTPDLLEQTEGSLTGDWLAGRRGNGSPTKRRSADHGSIRLTGARGNNLKNITVQFPLGLLCLVTGVSGSGKSTLVEQTLYPALAHRLRKDAAKPLDHDDVFGDGQLDDVVMIDQSPIGRSPRSNPVTYIKAFDAIRAVMADTPEARLHNFTASHFTFNVDGGRCEACRGDGYNMVDMQFLADVYMKCDQCNGRRYRREILEVCYRGRNIAEVLDMTVREAFTFFRGYPKVQIKLKRLIDVGLDYLRLGQRANTLSGGESQRLKLASHLSATRRGRSLFVLDEPTTGLHFADILQLFDCFDALLDAGHSLLVIEHNLQVMKAADYIIDLGPGAADAGGQVVAEGTPEQVASNPNSATGRHLAEALAKAPM